nr:hypothetical protein [candidate division Zixibacteria bacterium]
MKYLGKILFLTIIIVCLAISLKAALFLPVNQPEYGFLYESARHEEIGSGFYNYNYNVGPYDFETIRINNPLVKTLNHPDQNSLTIFLFAAGNFRGADDIRGRVYQSFRGGLAARPLKNVFVYGNFLIDEALADNPDYTGKIWHGAGGETENAYIAYSTKRIDIIVGRYSSFWGPVAHSLILSSTARSMDALSFRLKWGRLGFTFQTGKLNSSLLLTDSIEVYENRYFAGHRIDFRVYDNLQLGLFETIIYGGMGRGLSLSYFNPLLFYHAVQLNDNTDDNTFLGLDLCWYINNRHKLYGQVLVDDLQIDDDEPGDREPPEIAWLAGVHTIDLFNFIDLQIEYVRIANRTYNQKLELNRYENRGELLGYPMGPDFDRVNLVLTHWFESHQKAAIALTYQRRGEGRYDDPWTEPWLEMESDYHESFPSGTVEKTVIGTIYLSGFYFDHLFMDFNGGLKRVTDYDNQAGDNRTIPFFKATISLFLSTDLNID